MAVRQRSFLNAVKWAYTANWGEKASSSFFTFVLAALLGPRDFGIVALAMIYIAFIQMFLNQGLVTALIQKKNLDDRHLNSVFCMNLLIGALLAVISISLSRWWAAVSHVPQLSAVVSVLSFCIPIEALSIVQASLLQREMDFRSLSLRANVSVVAGGCIGLGMAYSGCGVWALVGQQLTRDLVALLLLWKQSTWRPRIGFSGRAFRELLGFSSQNFIAQIAVFADAQSGAIMLGTFFGPVAVGLYRLAERLVSAVQAVATSSIQSVSLPEFSRLQDKPEELRKSVLTCVRLSATVTLPAMAGILATGDVLMRTMGDKWIAAAQVLKLLSVFGMMSIFTIFTGPLLQALSRTRLLAVLEWTRTILGTLLLVVAGMAVREASLQVQVSSIAIVRLSLAALFVTPVYLFLLVRLSRAKMRDIATSILPSAASAIAAVVGVAFVRYSYSFVNWRPWMLLACEVVVGGALAVVMLLWLDVELRTAMASLLQRRFFPLASKGTA